jgi:catechol 2,3-dioxygenase-like lactoylglutathione lyase family enzyme
MEHIVGNLLRSFEEGKMNRRQLVQCLVAAASGAAVVGSVPAQAAESPFKATKIDHISYTVADYRKTRDFYSGLLGMKVTADEGTRCRLHVGDIEILARNGASPTPLIDHIGYSIADWNRDAVFAELKRRNLNPQLPRSGSQTSFSIKDPDGFPVQLVAAGR